MLRFLNNSKIADKISTKSILEKFELLSVNQINAEIKLEDMLKATHIDNYPTKIKKLNKHQGQNEWKLGGKWSQNYHT